jgi:hypothetical protein
MFVAPRAAFRAKILSDASFFGQNQFPMRRAGKLRSFRVSVLIVLPIACLPVICAGDDETGSGSSSARPPRVLLLGQSPDRHPWSTHEYADGLRILQSCLQRVDRVQVITSVADPPWAEGPDLIDGADGIVIFLAEGAKWLGEDRARAAAFERFAARGGALVCLHWAMGCREAQPIDRFVKLFGGCHGGPERKYRVAKVRATPSAPDHPVCRGIAAFDVDDEFYYRLKFAKPTGTAHAVVPLLTVSIDQKPETVAWAWERADGGRSFGFSGLHFHRNWELPEYRRLVVQGVLWTLKRPLPPAGIDVRIPADELALRRPKKAG